MKEMYGGSNVVANEERSPPPEIKRFEVTFVHPPHEICPNSNQTYITEVYGNYLGSEISAMKVPCDQNCGEVWYVQSSSLMSKWAD
jgi:hypothetical protein